MRKSIRILHVDDESSFLELTSEFLTLEDERFELVTETSPAAGLDRLDKSIDCVVSDFQMPSMNGIEFLEAVRESHPSLPFILFTGEGSETVASEAISAGATDYLQKQTGTEQYHLLANRILNAVESHQTQRELQQYKLLVETVGDPMYILDTDGAITLANKALAEMLGCSRETAVGTHASEFLAGDGYQTGRNRLRAILDDPSIGWSTYEACVEPIDGSQLPVEISLAPVMTEPAGYVASVGIVRDISSRKQREHRLEALHTTTRELIDAGTFEQAVDITIDAAEDILGMKISGFYAPAADDPNLLVPIATTAGVETIFETVPPVERDEGLIWQVYENETPIFAADVREFPDSYNAETPICSELLVPVDSHGVFVAGATTPGGFKTADETLAEILVSALAHALESTIEQENHEHNS